MCVVSMVIRDWQHPSWPDYDKLIPDIKPFNPGPNAIPWDRINNDPKLAQQMLEVLKKLEAIDKRLDALEQCKVAEPEKKAIKRRLKKIAASKRS